MIAGVAKYLVAEVHLAADGSQVATGTMYISIWRESDLKFWDGDSWETAPGSWPEATYKKVAGWIYLLSAAASAGMNGDTIHYTFTDHMTPGSATSVCGGGEHQVRTTTELVEISSGLRQVTIHFQDGDTNDIPNVNAAIYSEDNGTYKTQGEANAGGDMSVNLDDGTYSVRSHKDLWGFTNPETIVVTQDETFTITGTAFSAPTPSDPDYCVIYGTVRDTTGQPLAGARVWAQATTPQAVSAIQKSNRPKSTKTNYEEGKPHAGKPVGYFKIELTKLTEVRFKIAGGTNLDVVRTVPNAANQDVADWE